MPKTGEEADINYCYEAVAARRETGRDEAESRINVYAVTTREMCET